VPETLPVLSPLLPPLSVLAPHITKIDSSSHYTNHGPVWHEFRGGFQNYLSHNTGGLDVSAVFCGNGTLAIEVALRLRLGGHTNGLCLTPSYTFVATAHAIINAGLTPYFLDIERTALMLTPEIVVLALDSLPERPKAVVVVSAFGAPLDIKAWEKFEAEHGIVVVFDAAAATTSLSYIGAQPICLSLHATKTFGIGEGGAIVSTDRAFIEQAVSFVGFAFNGDRVSSRPAGNYRISDYTAAMGLAVLDVLAERLELLKILACTYRDALASSDAYMQDGCGVSWQTMTLNVVLPTDKVVPVVEKFDAESIQWRRWWSLGCHKHPAFHNLGRGPLSTTDEMAIRVIGVPFHPSLTERDIERVCDCIR
jgi:dTDP-4-amino-4,6-dideoxygalactose transaminase